MDRIFDAEAIHSVLTLNAAEFRHTAKPPEESMSEVPAVSEIEVPNNRLREASPELVYQSSLFIDVGGKENVRYRDIMWFDLSKYTTDSQVGNAILSLYWYYPAENKRSEDTVIEIYRPASTWNSNYVSWNKRDKGVVWKNPGGDWYDKNGVSAGQYSIRHANY